MFLYQFPQLAGYVHLGHQQERYVTPATFLRQAKISYWNQDWHQAVSLLPASLLGAAVMDRLEKPSAQSENTSNEVVARQRPLRCDLSSVLCIYLPKKRAWVGAVRAAVTQLSGQRPVGSREIEQVNV